MKVILVRHGEAVRQVGNDSKRHLTEFGKHQAQLTAAQIMATYSPDCAVVSPYDRAQETLTFFTSLDPSLPVHVYDGITPSDDATIALKHLAKETGDSEVLLVVCHMDIVARLAALLTDEQQSGFCLAEARVFETSALVAGFAKQIDGFIPPQP